MRIAQVCGYSLTPPGGVQAQVLGLARSLRGLGHQVRVLAPCDGPPPDSGVTPLGKSVPLATNGSVAPIAPDPACALRTIRALWDEEFDVVHVHEPLVPGPPMTAVLMSDRTIGTFHRAGSDRIYSVLGRAARPIANRLRLRTAVSVDARETAHQVLGGEYELLFNGIEVDRFAKAAERKADVPTILFLGRHEPRKGLDVLLEAASGDRLPGDIRIWIAGDGPQTAELKARHAGNHRLEWLGRLSEEEKAVRFRSADVFCSPAVSGESFGIVLLEAMAASTAVVASDIPGHRNVVPTHGEHGLLVPPGDPDALAAALRRVIDDGVLRRQLVEAGEARAAELSMDNLADRYLALYERVID
ncbi:MAG TPA: glycosyltransferase family 4 protein [Acidimicrobiales bacterium]|jgi:phosphatidyl-myo-inositol alpha-mannosyltransferase|nr:glycosyltransferase family 4 protein [Acidimicrobiales bacterium]